MGHPERVVIFALLILFIVASNIEFPSPSLPSEVKGRFEVFKQQLSEVKNQIDKEASSYVNLDGVHL